MDMTEILSPKNRNDFVFRFVIASMVNTNITKEAYSDPKIVTMQINGVEIDPLNAIKRYEDALDDVVDRRVKEKLNEMKWKMIEPLQEKIDKLCDFISEEIGVQDEEDY